MNEYIESMFNAIFKKYPELISIHDAGIHDSLFSFIVKLNDKFYSDTRLPDFILASRIRQFIWARCVNNKDYMKFRANCSLNVARL